MIHLSPHSQRVPPPERNAWTKAVLEFPAQALRDLPQAIALHLDVPGSPLPVVFSVGLHARRSEANEANEANEAENSADGASSATDFERGLNAAIVFDRDELHALVLGLEADRIWHRDFLGFCFEKWRTSSFRLTEEIALAGANPDPQLRWSTARVLSRLQARITDVEWLDTDSSEARTDERAQVRAASATLWAAA